MSRIGGVLEGVGRSLAVADKVVPFTAATYDAAHPERVTSSQRVSTSSAMALPAAYACTVVISEDIGKVPLQMFEMVGDERRLARQHPLYDLLHDQANTEESAIEFRESMTAVALNRGEAIAEKVPGPRGLVDQLVRLHPDRVTWEEGTRGRRLIYQDPVKGQRILTRDEVFVVRGRFGVGVVTVMRMAFGTQLAMLGYQAEMYGRGMRSPGSLTHPARLSDPARANVRKSLDEYMSGGERAGKPLLLEEGMKWETIALSMQDAQFLETLQHGVADVCRAYRVPQHKIQELTRSTNNNIETQSIEGVTDSLIGWAIRWEQAIRRDLIVVQDRFMAKHNLEGLLRGDVKTRFEAYAIAVQLGWLTRAEVRQKEDLNPIDGLDDPLVPLNMGTVPGTGGTVPLQAVHEPHKSLVEPSSPAVASYLRGLVQYGAAAIVRRETVALRKIAGKGDWESGVVEFYDGHAEQVARQLRLPAESAVAYCQDRAASLAVKGPAAVADAVDDADALSALTSLALRQADLLADFPIGATA